METVGNRRRWQVERGVSVGDDDETMVSSTRLPSMLTSREEPQWATKPGHPAVEDSQERTASMAEDEEEARKIVRARARKG
mmetsp:Transcript_60023/g.127134  ORF Transcript_60023/g.127134 Transcript_60023/m.127134 type:complete len:81 (+) Transcript_60023:159-401(+)